MQAVLTHLLLAALGDSLLFGRDLGVCLDRDSAERVGSFEVVMVLVGET